MPDLDTLLAVLATTLGRFIWQAALIAGVYALTKAFTRRSAPGVRYGMACGALFALAVVPAATLIAAWTDRAVGVPFAAGGAMTPPSAAMPWLLGLWSLGVGLLATRFAVGWVQLRRMIEVESRRLDDRWNERIETLKRRVGLSRAVRVLETGSVCTPIVTGCLRPTILLPLTALTGLRPEDLEALILHELVHVRRWDLWVQRLQLAVETLFFYHPAVWWISHSVNVEREYSCDAEVVSITGDNIGYARALARMETLRSRPPRTALAFTGGTLMSRIRKIVHPSTRAQPAPLSTALSGLAAVLFAVFLVATTSVVADSLNEEMPAWVPDRIARWAPQFEEAAERHGVDPALLSIMTLIESNGNPDATSSLGAVGLMQILPQTADSIARERGIANFHVEDLRDPAINIDFGAWYLANQIEAFGDGELSDRTVELAATAYNGGPVRLRKHLELGLPLTEESKRYSGLVTALWRDRDQPRSATYDRLTAR